MHGVSITEVFPTYCTNSHYYCTLLKYFQLTAQTQVLNGFAVPLKIFVDAVPLKIRLHSTKII